MLGGGSRTSYCRRAAHVEAAGQPVRGPDAGERSPGTAALARREFFTRAWQLSLGGHAVVQPFGRHMSRRHHVGRPGHAGVGAATSRRRPAAAVCPARCDRWRRRRARTACAERARSPALASRQLRRPPSAPAPLSGTATRRSPPSSRPTSDALRADQRPHRQLDNGRRPTAQPAPRSSEGAHRSVTRHHMRGSRQLSMPISAAGGTLRGEAATCAPSQRHAPPPRPPTSRDTGRTPAQPARNAKGKSEEALMPFLLPLTLPFTFAFLTCLFFRVARDTDGRAVEDVAVLASKRERAGQSTNFQSFSADAAQLLQTAELSYSFPSSSRRRATS